VVVCAWHKEWDARWPVAEARARLKGAQGALRYMAVEGRADGWPIHRRWATGGRPTA